MMPVPRVIIPIIALLVFGALFIICALAVLPYVVRRKLEMVSTGNSKVSNIIKFGRGFLVSTAVASFMLQTVLQQQSC